VKGAFDVFFATFRAGQCLCWGLAAFLVAMLAASEASGAGPSTTRYRYALVEADMLYDIDKSQMILSVWSFPDPPVIVNGQYIADGGGYGFGNCSNAKYLCLDFEDFALSVPIVFRGKEAWEAAGWKFRIGTCLEGRVEHCSRYSVVFRKEESGNDGGLVFSSKNGVEMFYHSIEAGRGARRVFVKTSMEGVFAGSRL